MPPPKRYGNRYGERPLANEAFPTSRDKVLVEPGRICERPGGLDSGASRHAFGVSELLPHHERASNGRESSAGTSGSSSRQESRVTLKESPA